MTVVWFIVWLIANNVGGHEPLTADPVNAWLATLVLAVALDLSASHAQGRREWSTARGRLARLRSPLPFSSR